MTAIHRSQTRNSKLTLMPYIILFVLFMGLTQASFNLRAAQSNDAIWNLQTKDSKGLFSKANTVSVQTTNELLADTRALQEKLSEAPDIKNKELGQSGIYLYLPLDDASFSLFEVFEKKVISNARKTYIKTYLGYGINRPELVAHLDIGTRGFHAMIIGDGKTIFIDPDIQSFKESISLNQKISKIPNRYRAFKAQKPTNFHCGFENTIQPTSVSSTTNMLAKQGGNELRTYRLAVTTSVNYAEAVSIGETEEEKIEETLAAIATAINRINVIYNQDLSIQLELIEDERLIVIDPELNPFTDNADDDIDIVTDTIDELIGNTNYDIGHLFTVSGGGLALFQSVCDSNDKGKGVTGVEAVNLQSDAFYIDYVAHEIGHQFGANHSYNGTSGACGGNRNSTTAFEPGSGSTIMAYAGICDEENLQTRSDAYFHAGSIDEILKFVNTSTSGGSCKTTSPIENNPPTVNAGNNYTIPANTPFRLSASGNDIEDDLISYTWEQLDTGTSTSNQAEMKQDNGSRTLFRSFPGTNNPTRFFPSFDDVLDNTLTIGETFPSTTRNLHFRVTARSGIYGTATNSESPTIIQTINTGSSFSVIEPKENSYHYESSNMIVLWDKTNTQNSPINCSEVDILFSNTGGNDYESFSVLLNNTANDGKQSVVLPTGVSTTARLLVQCSDNIFYNINKGNFNIVTNDSTLLSIDIDAAEQNEGNSDFQNFQFKITRTGDLNQSSSVSYQLTGFGAHPTDKSDFSSTQTFSGTINFDNNESEKELNIRSQGDVLREENEQFQITLSNPSNAFIATGTAIATILNDEQKSKHKKSSGGSFIYTQLLFLSLLCFFKRMYSAGFLIMLIINISSCSQIPPRLEQDVTNINKSEKNQHPQILSLLWIKDADPIRDANRAIQQKENLFLASAPRGQIKIPGLSDEKQKLAIAHGYKVQEGMGDLIINNEHEYLRKTFIKYAAQYNQILANYYLKNEQ